MAVLEPGTGARLAPWSLEVSAMGVQDKDQTAVNEVRVRGRVASAPQARILPSGDELWTFRLVVPREPQPPREDGRRVTRSDWLTCTVWTGRCRRVVSRWSEGDEVEVEGALRRRHYRTATGATSVLEVEVASARRARG